jgi:hypothetical protein
LIVRTTFGSLLYTIGIYSAPLFCTLLVSPWAYSYSYRFRTPPWNRLQLFGQYSRLVDHTAIDVLCRIHAQGIPDAVAPWRGLQNYFCALDLHDVGIASTSFSLAFGQQPCAFCVFCWIPRKQLVGSALGLSVCKGGMGRELNSTNLSKEKRERKETLLQQTITIQNFIRLL